MDNIEKLLQSTVSEDIALGLFLMSKKGLINDKNYLIRVNYKEYFVIRIKGYSGWTTIKGTETYVHFIKGEDNFNWSLTFDFRTKEEI